MTTRGYVTLIDEDKKILLSAYLTSDAYPSFYGLEILDALQEGKLPSYIAQLLSTYPEDKEMVEGIARDWYIKGKDSQNQFFVDYAYEYDPSAQKLNLYYFGEKALTIPVSKLSFYRRLFEMENQFEIPLQYDPASCMLKKPFYPELRRMIRTGASIEDFQKLSEQTVLYLNRYRMKGYGWHEDDFSKEIRDSGSGDRMIIHASRFGKRDYSLYIQTPFYRAPLSSRPLLTPGAVEKELARLIHDRPEDLRGTMTLYSKIDEYKRTVEEVFANDSVPYPEREAAGDVLLNDIRLAMQEASNRYKLLGFQADSFSRQVKEVFLSKAQKARTRAGLDKPALDKTIASAEVQTQDNTEQTPEEAHLER